MNQTKKLTTGAMLLAICGAVMILDRQFSYAFEYLLTLVMPIVVIIYAAKYTIADGAILCVGLAILSFLFEGITSQVFLYLPVTIITAMGYSFGLKKKFNKNLLLYTACIIYMIGEVVTTFVVIPIFGIDINTQLSAIIEPIKEWASGSGITIDLTENIFLMIYAVSMIVTGVLEGFLIHLVTCFLLKRFKIMDIESLDFFSKRPNPVIGYVCLALVSIFFFVTKFEDNQIIFISLTSIAMIAVIVLFYSGYMFTIFFGRTIAKGKFNIFIILAVVLLFPYSAFILVILGFLYLTGPLRDYLERRIIINEKQ